MTVSKKVSESHRIDPASLSALPHSTGVYVFRGTSTLPLYIGKSLDIRSRVLSHLRAADEARMIAQTRRIDYIETAGEIGALLLESQMIKAYSPLYNIRLRRVRSLCSLRLLADQQGLVPKVVSGNEADIGRAPDLFGLFSSRHAAIEKLRHLAAEYQLCLALLGLERTTNRGCFGLQIKTCQGACVGKEDRTVHDKRLRDALADLQVHAWPYRGAISVIERNGAWVQKHRVHDWRYLGTWCSKTRLFTKHHQPSFDLDTYKILVRPIMLGQAELELDDQDETRHNYEQAGDEKNCNS